MRAALASPTAREDARATASMRGIESVESGGASERWGEDGGDATRAGRGENGGTRDPPGFERISISSRAGGGTGEARDGREGGGVERD